MLGAGSSEVLHCRENSGLNTGQIVLQSIVLRGRRMGLYQRIPHQYLCRNITRTDKSDTFALLKGGVTPK